MSEFLGRWRITEMEEWDSDYIDLVVPGYFEFGENELGHFHFGVVECDIDYRIEEYGDGERLEFSFEGDDEGDPVCGRGWAVRKGKALEGRLFFHRGDESDFKAKRS